MTRSEDMVRAFWRITPERVTEATELWLAVEQGERNKLPTLRRLMHTIKGEAQMLGLDSCAALFERAEKVVDDVIKCSEWPQSVGDALLGTFELLGLLEASDDAEQPEAVAELCSQLDDARERLQSAPPLEAKRAPASEGDAARSEPAERPREADTTPASQSIPIYEMQPLVDEVRRLQSERELLQGRLRTALRTLQTLAQDPVTKEASEQLAQRRGMHNLGEVTRDLSNVAADQSANDFATDLLIEQMEDSVRRASVIPLAKVEAQIHRTARSVAQAVGKSVDVSVDGDAMLDAAVERRLTPALLHLVRNAIDHGIEDSATRAERAKAERGRIEVSLTQAESSVRVVVEDDGGGIDFDRLRQRLTQRGADPSTLTRERLMAALFEHGMTTREEATTISGRGVGLDVVAAEVGAVGGRVNAESTPGMGTRFVLVMPATLRVDMAVPIVAGSLHCALPSRVVTEVVRVGHLEATSRGPMLRTRIGDTERPVPLRSLTRMLTGGGDDPRVGDAALVVAHPAGHFALTVDAYDTPRPVAAQPTRDLAARSPFVRGVAPTADGGILLLLDAVALHEAVTEPAASPSTTSAAERPHHVLVVEDAPVARELLCGILRSFGLRVSTAADGQQGLNIARRDPPDLVLTDVEMPVLGGLEMLSQLRSERGLEAVPVLVLTNRTDEPTRKRAQALGVHGFLAKESFVESELRERIDECLPRRGSA